MATEVSPTARALIVLELLQGNPGITAGRLGEKLGVSERAVRRYVGILREAGIPIESSRGTYGGYRVGRGVRIPPLMFSQAEALGLVMAVLAGHHGAPDPAHPVEGALSKLIRVLPEAVAAPAEAVRAASARNLDRRAAPPSPEITALLGQSCATRRRLRLTYQQRPGVEYEVEVDPWAVVVRHGRWYLLCWSHPKNARRVLRVDRVAAVDVLDDTFTPPVDLDPIQALEEHLAQGWSYQVEVVVEAPVATVARWVPRSQGRLEEIDANRTRLIATTDEPDWYAEQLTAIKAPFHIVAPSELVDAARELAHRLLAATRSEGPTR